MKWRTTWSAAPRLCAKGLEPDEAARQAERRFGNVTQLREQSRDIRLSAALENTFQDIRYALRGMRKSPRSPSRRSFRSPSPSARTPQSIRSSTPPCSALSRSPQPERLFTLATPCIGTSGPNRRERNSFSYPSIRTSGPRPADSARLALFSTAEAVVEVQIPSQRTRPSKRPFANSFRAMPSRSYGSRPRWAASFRAEDDRVPRWPSRGSNQPRLLAAPLPLSTRRSLNQRLLIAQKAMTRSSESPAKDFLATSPGNSSTSGFLR